VLDDQTNQSWKGREKKERLDNVRDFEVLSVDLPFVHSSRNAFLANEPRTFSLSDTTDGVISL
jgi:hypothetical protein